MSPGGSESITTRLQGCGRVGKQILQHAAVAVGPGLTSDPLPQRFREAKVEDWDAESPYEE